MKRLWNFIRSSKKIKGFLFCLGIGMLFAFKCYIKIGIVQPAWSIDGGFCVRMLGFMTCACYGVFSLISDLLRFLLDNEENK